MNSLYSIKTSHDSLYEIIFKVPLQNINNEPKFYLVYHDNDKLIRGMVDQQI